MEEQLQSINDLKDDPWIGFQKWSEQANQLDLKNPNAMCLSTIENNQPQSRVVLLKEFSARDGLIFYTNYTSAKSKQIEQNPFASVLFYWDQLERQIRIAGKVTKVSKEQSKAYFHSRPYESQIGAWASKQSHVLSDRTTLLERYEKYENKFTPKQVDYPDFWGGFSLIPQSFEFWQGLPSRMHARKVYQKDRFDQWQHHLLYP